MPATYRVISAPDRSWNPAQRWAYALGAPYNVQHDLPVDALPAPGAALRDRLTKMLQRDWSVEGAEDLARILAWLGREGHRIPHRHRIRQYCLMRRPAVAARREELREAARRDREALEELWRLDAVQADWNGVRGGVMLAFDAARAAMLARCGLVLGWLEPAPAWRYLTDMAADVQRSYGSWPEYAADYTLSHAFWAATPIPGPFLFIARQLRRNRRSPWRALPWAVAGLEIPRSPAPADDDGPAWVLER